MKFPIGVIIDSFRTDIPTAVKKAAQVGAQGIQVYATRGEMSPREMRSLSAPSARISAGSLRTTDSLSPLSAAISAAASATKRRTPGESRSQRG